MTERSNDGRRRVTLAEFKLDLQRRLEEVGPIDMPPNSGRRRTKSKRMLLDALAKLRAPR